MPKNKPLTVNYKNIFLTTIKEKYPYFLLGFTTVLVIFLALANLLIKGKKTTSKIASQQKEKQQIVQSDEVKTYTVKRGDFLWEIAENAYGSGFNAYDIAKANNILEPGLIYTGQKLVLPSVTPKPPTVGEIVPAKTEKVTLTDVKYTIKENDNLWKIAFEAYGDGYAWTRIAKANNLIDPGVIHVGNVLVIPR